MVASGGDPDFEHAWSQTRKGVTLFIPSHEQLRAFESSAYREFSMQYWTTQEQRQYNYLLARCRYRDDVSQKNRILDEALQLVSRSTNFVLHMETEEDKTGLRWVG